jgi:heavy metal sensor kinase
MNTRSLRFQLITWYAGLLLGVFGVIGIATYLALEKSLTRALEGSQMRRAREVAHLLSDWSSTSGASSRDKLTQEIETSFAPSQNSRFLRITTRDGETLYSSQSRTETGFDPAFVGPPQWPATTEGARTVRLPDGRAMMLIGHRIQAPDSKLYLVEAGAPLDAVQSDSRKWLFFLAAMLPVVAFIALGGGYFLVNRALSPVDQISASAERISSHNLGERLPVAQTGDELERLSIALNLMIHRLDTSFQHSRRFVADASHELRTPLTILRGELETFVSERELPSDWRERLNSALEEVVRLSHIVEGLFSISRLDAGEAAAEWAKFDLSQLAASTADQMSLLAEDKNLKVICNATRGIWVEGDRARLKQVVVNLLDNAIKYTPEGGTVTLSVNSNENKALLEVADTGIGIPAKALPQIFDRFFRVDKARSRGQGGAGLGLSIVKSIITAHQGVVKASSTPGKGSQFRVELPLLTMSGETNKENNQKHHELQPS